MIIALALLIVIGGCKAPQAMSTLTKSIQVTKDADGKIVSSTVTETVTQSGLKVAPIRFEYKRSQ